MTLRAVKAYVAQQATSGAAALLNGQSVWTEVHAYAQRPKLDKAGHRVLVVIGRWRRREERMTSPRGSGEKERVYLMDLLLYATASDELAGGDAFDTLTENLFGLFATATPGNPTLTDAVTGQQSYLTHIGETGDVEMLPVMSTATPQGRVSFRSIVRLEIREVVSPA